MNMMKGYVITINIEVGLKLNTTETAEIWNSPLHVY